MSSQKENTRICCMCGSSPSKDPSITLHRFPKPGVKNLLRCELWAKYCFPNEPWSNPKFLDGLYSKHKMLCSKHFLSTCFIEKKLFKTAVPSVQSHKDTTISNLQDQPAIIDAVAGPSRIYPLTEHNANIITSANSTMFVCEPSKQEGDQKSKMLIEQKLFKTAVPSVQSHKDTTISNLQDQAAIIDAVAGPSRIYPLTEHNANIITSANSTMFVCEPSKQEGDQKSKMLIRKLKNSMNKVYRLQGTLKHLKNEAFLNAICDNDTVKKILDKKMSSTFALLLQGELQNYNRKKLGRRWNMEAKIIALRLYKKSPTSYKLLRRMICLPAPSTLKSILSKFKMNVGIQEKILKELKNSTKHFRPSEREYILLWDEMSLRKNLWYNPKVDLIEGFQDHATQGRSPEAASYALVFMLVGVRKQVKQPVAYYLSSGFVKADRLSALIKEVLNCCFDAEINICASVCDLDGVNKRALCLLGASVENPCIEVSNHKIVTLFDTPHLLKCFRNLFIKYDVKFRTNITSDDKQGIGIAKWSHIRQFYELDNNNPNFVFAPCLTKQHLQPNSKQKMRVKLAAQILSHSVAAGLYTKIAAGDMSTEALATANLLANMDELFDGVNASTPNLRRGKKFSTNIKENSEHLHMFLKMKNFFKTLEFLGCRGNPPSKDGWIWTLNGIEMVWRILSNKYKSIKSLSTRRFQQDPLENLFGCIRSNCGSNCNPTVQQFVAAFKTAVISNMAHVSSGNCELDSNSAIITNFKTLLTPATDMRTDMEQSEPILYQIEKEIEENITSSLEQNLEEGSSELQACAYVCGFIIKKIKNNCNNCTNILVSETPEEVHNFIEFKNYESVKKSLTYASKNLIDCVEKSATLINVFLGKEAYKENIKMKITQLLKDSINYDFLENCVEHKKLNISYIINSVSHIIIKRYCILKNRTYSEEALKSTLKRKMNIIMHK